MKIVIIAGFARSLLHFRSELIKGLVAQGHEVVTLAPEPGYEMPLQAIGAGYYTIPLKRTGMNPFRDVMTVLFLWRKLCKLKPDLVLSYTIKPVIYGSIAAKLAGTGKIYSIITGLGYVFTGMSIKQRLLSFLVCPLYRGALRCNHKVFFQNKDDKMEFCRMRILELAEKGVVVNGSGVDTSFFVQSEVSDNPLCFLLIGRLLWEKGIGEYVEAARALKSSYPAVNFQLLGPMDSNPSARGEDVLDAWRVEGAIDYLGVTDDVRPFIAKSSVYVLPSYREGTPNSVLEAMSMGRPIVTTDVPGCRETVRDGDNGFLVPPRDVSSLKKAMERFILQPELLDIMGRRSREIAVDKYDVHKVKAVMLRTMGLADEARI